MEDELSVGGFPSEVCEEGIAFRGLGYKSPCKILKTVSHPTPPQETIEYSNPYECLCHLQLSSICRPLYIKNEYQESYFRYHMSIS